MNLPAAPTADELNKAWQQQDHDRLAGWFCAAPADHDPWITGAWQEQARDFIRRSVISGDDERTKTRLVDLFRLAQRVYEQLWREGRSFQPAWWRDVTIPELLQQMTAPSYRDAKWQKRAMWGNTQSLPDGWPDIEPWLQNWMDNLVAFYRRDPGARREEDRLGFFEPLRPSYTPAAHFILALRLLNRSIAPVLNDAEGACYARKLCAYFVTLAVSPNNAPDNPWPVCIATIVRDIPRTPPVCDRGIPSFDKLLQDVRNKGLID